MIGVAPDIQQYQMDDDTPPVQMAYVPYPVSSFANIGVVVRTAADPAGLTAAVRSEIRAADPRLPVFNVRTMEDLRRSGFWQFRLFGFMRSIRLWPSETTEVGCADRPTRRAKRRLQNARYNIC